MKTLLWFTKFLGAGLVATIVGYWLLLGAGYAVIRYLIWAEITDLSPASCIKAAAVPVGCAVAGFFLSRKYLTKTFRGLK